MFMIARLSNLTDIELKVITKFYSKDEFVTFDRDERTQLRFAFESMFEFLNESEKWNG
jgi:hypothetical protein